MLTAKHPQEIPNLDVEYAPRSGMPAHLEVSESDVLKATQKFPLRSAGGGSGLCPNRVFELSRFEDYGHGSTFIGALTTSVNLFLLGKGPAELATRL